MRDLLNELENAEKADGSDPMVAAQKSMQANLPKRFYEDVSLGEAEEGYSILLDGKTVRTPARSVLTLPNEALAELLADEWRSQKEVINPNKMPATRLANTAVDGVANEASAVVEDILRFASNDLLFYRAANPQELVERQRLQWDPVIDRFETVLGQRFELTEGIMHVNQPEATLNALRSHVAGLSDAFEIACLHTMTTLTGSALLALDVRAGNQNYQEAWNQAHLDEDWNIEQWGEDSEAQARRNARWLEMQAAGEVLNRLKG